MVFAECGVIRCPLSTPPTRRFNEDANPGLLRIASKMATGRGKTLVMAMFIAWHTPNKIANQMPGHKSRLRNLKPIVA